MDQIEDIKAKVEEKKEDEQDEKKEEKNEDSKDDPNRQFLWSDEYIHYLD